MQMNPKSLNLHPRGNMHPRARFFQDVLGGGLIEQRSYISQLDPIGSGCIQICLDAYECASRSAFFRNAKECGRKFDSL